MSHLRKHFEPLEVFRQGRTADYFVYDVERQAGEVIGHYDTGFNIFLRRVEDVARPVNPRVKAHVFLREANVSAERQSQIVSAATSRNECEALRDAMLMAIPRAGALHGGRSFCASVRRPSAPLSRGGLGTRCRKRKRRRGSVESRLGSRPSLRR